MGRTIVEVLELALAVAVVPIPVIAVILMLLSKSATRNTVSFLVGWLLGRGVPSPSQVHVRPQRWIA
jgi:hypothetical protein